MAENIKSRKYYRVHNGTDWDRMHFVTDANSVDANDGDTMEVKVGAIKGITTSTDVTEEGYAADAKTVSELNNSLGNLGNMSSIYSNTYNSLEKLLRYYIDNDYLPDVNLMPLVPIMTSNTLPSGEVTASSTYSGYAPYYAFNGNEKSKGWTASDSAKWGSTYLTYKFPTAQKVVKARVYMYDGNDRGIYNIVRIQASNDNETWDNLCDDFTMSGTNVWNPIFLNNDKYYLYYRLLLVGSLDSSLKAGVGNGYHLQYYGEI